MISGLVRYRPQDTSPERGCRADRVHLQAFQKRLFARTREANEDHRDVHRWLAVQCGEQRWLIDPHKAVELLTSPVLTPIPHTHRWCLGVFSRRGRVISAIDLDAFLGHRPLRWQAEDRLLLLSPLLPVSCALRVSRDARLVDVASWTPLEVVSPERPWMRRGYQDSQQQRWHLLELSLLMTDPTFRQVGIC